MERAGQIEDGDGAELARELAVAIERGELELYYQPIVALADRSVTRLEALPRWPHPRHGVLAPADFIAAAESGDLLPALERWAIEAAFRQLALWSSGVAAEMTIALNLSEDHAFHADLAGFVSSTAARSSASAERIGFEITEAALIEAGGRSLAKLREIAALGPAFTVDDYSGGLSADLLRELPVDALKIGRRTVEGIPDDARRLESAMAAIRRGRELDVTTIAVGIESPGQLASLRELGCGYGQGFFFSVPMPVKALAERMSRR
jgi:EAL domain-containing protein (putative c-di-GMP-specific phosphodiesterase class I)